jgi:restriction endonuclease S subunit
MIKEAIKNIAEVVSGFPFRNTNQNEVGDIPVIRARDINGDINISVKDCVKVSSRGLNTKAIIQDQDLVVSQKGPFNAAVANDSCAGSLADFSVFVLRNISQAVRPKYLAAFFNSKIGKAHALKSAKGSLIKSFTKKELEEMELPILSLDDQELVVKIYENKQKQMELLERKKELIGQVVESAIKQIINNKEV